MSKLLCGPVETNCWTILLWRREVYRAQGAYLAGLGQAHAHPEAGGHTRRQGGGQRAAQARIDHPDTSDHRLHNQLTGELAHPVHVLPNLPVGHKNNVESPGELSRTLPAEREWWATDLRSDLSERVDQDLINFLHR